MSETLSGSALRLALLIRPGIAADRQVLSHTQSCAALRDVSESTDHQQSLTLTHFYLAQHVYIPESHRQQLYYETCALHSHLSIYLAVTRTHFQ